MFGKTGKLIERQKPYSILMYIKKLGEIYVEKTLSGAAARTGILR